MGEERDYAGLSSSQQNIWNLEQAYPGLPLNNICTSLYIEGNFRVDLLQKCIELAYVAYPVLRTRIPEKKEKFYSIQLRRYRPRLLLSTFPERIRAASLCGTSLWQGSICPFMIPASAR